MRRRTFLAMLAGLFVTRRPDPFADRMDDLGGDGWAPPPAGTRYRMVYDTCAQSVRREIISS